jgi:hypothetical protein
MAFKTSIDFRGDTAKALEAGRDTLMQMGFRISSIDRGRLVAEGKGRGINSRIPLSGVSRIVLTGSSSRLELEAEWGGIKAMGVFLVALILGMAVLFLILFGFLFGWERGLQSTAPLAPWPVLIPLMLLIFKKRDERGLKTFLANMVTVGEDR